jgi:integrase
MTWVPPPKAYWRKVYDGKVYTISCRELGVEKTKEGSYKSANAWWQNKMAEIDTANRPPEPRPAMPGEDLVAALLGLEGGRLTINDFFRMAVRRYGEHREAALRFLEDQADPPPRKDEEEEDQETVTILEDGRQRAISEELGRWLISRLQQPAGTPVLTPEVAQLLPPARVQAIETSVAGFRGEAAASHDQSVKHFNSHWLENKKLAVCPDRYQLYVRQMDSFLSFVGENADVKSLNGRTLDDFYTFCLQKASDPDGWSSVWARDTFVAVKAFITWLDSIEVISPLRILNKRFPFDTRPPEPVPWTDDELHTALGFASERMRLYILLALNAGMGQKDISDLKATEINWTKGTVTRYRSKAKNYTNRRKVSYPLWPSTLALLKKHNSGQEQVLLSEKGKPLWGEKRLDLIINQYRDLREKIRKKKPGFARTFYDLRLTGAYRIDEQFGRDLAHLYTAHAAKGVTELHYTNALQKRLNEAVFWLGQQLGQVPVESEPTTSKRRRPAAN